MQDVYCICTGRNRESLASALLGPPIVWRRQPDFIEALSPLNRLINSRTGHEPNLFLFRHEIAELAEAAAHFTHDDAACGCKWHAK